ncbi:shikimate dehydrogenase [Chamaesiphon sp. VAR_69_metabat_338]|uniref:shikimate dehydrogenase n=1 Tax=Chamaesiphon sp. VAR_69_metabat_338 TaxID=2964704 RepID=UPI00286D76D2|nr:shikimate dehydrogenase [Chamaesiphon sp. VAR_69_metabat_338]
MIPIAGTTKLLGVIGHPIAHTFSPAMHNAAIEQLGLDYRYVAFDVAPADLATALAGFAAIGVVGCSVTIPHKQAIMPLLAQITPLAQAIGAVNTIWNTPTGWHGTNTDIAGFIAPLAAMQRDWGKTTAIVLGNGGAARAVVAGCHQLGCQEIHVFGRDAAKLADFGASWQDIQLQRSDSETSSVQIQTHLWSELATFIDRDNLLLINCTPMGMHPQVGNSPIDEALMSKIGTKAIVYDLIYTPRPTKFLQLATANGATAIDGLEMLIQQGAIAFELWLHQAAPIGVMRRALLELLES